MNGTAPIDDVQPPSCVRLLAMGREVIEVTRTIELDGDPGDVWDLVVDGDRWSEWMVDDAAVEVAPGSAGHVDDDGGRREVRIETVNEGEGVSFEWWPAGRRDLASTVELRILPAPPGAVLEVVESFPASGTLGARAAHRAWRARDRRLAIRLELLRPLVAV
jgi:uncharacterized protein YndB with AHSA1/START domain